MSLLIASILSMMEKVTQDNCFDMVERKEKAIEEDNLQRKHTIVGK